MCHIWRMMIWGLFEKSGSLESDQKHRSAAENNPSSLVSGFYYARSRGTRVKCVSFFHKSFSLSGYCFLWCGRPVSWVLCCFCWLNIWRHSNEKDNKGGGLFRTLWPSVRETRIHVCHFSNTTIMTFTGFCLTWIPAQLLWRIKQFFPSVSLDAFTYFSLAIQSLFISQSFTEDLLPSPYHLTTHSTRRSLHPLAKRASQHGVSCVTPTDLMFPGRFLCVFFCLQEVWIRGILVALVHEWWLLTKGSFRDQRSKTSLCLLF